MSIQLITFVWCLCLASVGFVQGVPSPSEWRVAEKKTKNAVVQVLSYNAHFDWLEPYKAPQQKEASGTAFFIDEEGRLCTNFHVVEGAKTLKLYMPAIGKIDAYVVSVCPEGDIAVLQVTDKGLASIKKTFQKVPYLRFGDSDLLYPTEPVLASGYPLGIPVLKSTVGVVAGLRELVGDKFYMHTTTPINPGNSGGPLVNREGFVVGINTAAILKAQNVGFTIPSNDFTLLKEDLRTQSLVRKPFIGCLYNESTDEHARMLGNPLPAGVYINTVEKGSLAQQVGIRAGDMLYKINGFPVDSCGDVLVKWSGSFKVSLYEFLSRLPSKAPLTCELYRKGQKKVLQGNYISMNPQPLRFIYPDYEPQETDFELIGGACIMQLRANHLDFFKGDAVLQSYKQSCSSSKEVLIITKLLPGSLVHKLDCIYEGALLHEVNGKRVKNLTQFRAALLESATTGVVSLKTKNNVMIVLSLKDMCADEKRITKDFMVPTTKGMKALIESRKKDENKKA